jgi:hypothetical protein
MMSWGFYALFVHQCTGFTSKNSLHSLIDAQSKFYLFRQTARMSNAEYLGSFSALMDQITHLHGDFGIDHKFVTERILLDGDDPTNVEVYKDAILRVHEEYLATKFLLHSDSRRYVSLIANLQNDFVGGIDKYLKNISKAYDMLVNFVNPNRQHVMDDQDIGMSFYIAEQKGQEYNKWTCSGHVYGQDHADDNVDGSKKEKSTDGKDRNKAIGSATKVSTDTHTYLAASLSSIQCIEELLLMHSLPHRWLLVDSCSSADIFASRNLLRDVHPAPQPIWVRCNAGKVKLTHQRRFGSYPHPVWYNPKDVANILSLANVPSNIESQWTPPKGGAFWYIR